VTFNDPVFQAFNDFDIDDMPQADISRRMLRRLEDIDNSTTAGPTTAGWQRGQPLAQLWQPASWHTPWLNSRPNS
jgi:hypothetical protein